MIITYTTLATGVSRDIEIDDARCDEMLDRLAHNFMKPNPVELARWHAMMAKREAAAAPTPPPKKRRGR